MAEHLTEEEQVERLKRWWADNGRSVVVGVVLAVVGYFGWQGWQSQQQQTQEAASVIYDDLLEAATTEEGEGQTEEQYEMVASLANELKSEYSDLLYARDAALLLAKVAVEHGKLEEAEANLRWILEQDPEAPLSLLARLRLAQVLYGQGDYEQALATLDGAEPGKYAAGYAELRGDILMAQDQPAKAKAAYETALDELLAEQGNRREIIQMKLDDIQVATDASEAAASEADS